MSTTTEEAELWNHAVRSEGTPSNRELRPGVDLVNYVRCYAKAKPDVAALWCLGLGIIIGWKIKPW